MSFRSDTPDWGIRIIFYLHAAIMAAIVIAVVTLSFVAVKYVSKNGIKPVIERVWNGEKH